MEMLEEMPLEKKEDVADINSNDLRLNSLQDSYRPHSSSVWSDRSIMSNLEVRHSIAVVVQKTQKGFQRLPKSGQLMILYLCLLVLAGVGGLIFSYSEWYEEEHILRERLHYEETIFPQHFDEDQIADIKRYSHYRGLNLPANNGNMWEVRYAAFFAATIFTTCGFGLQAPKTNAGRLFVFIYGLPSILMYGFLSKKIGELSIYYMEKVAKSWFKVTHDRWEEIRLRTIAMVVFVGMILLTLYIWVTATNEGFGNGISGNGTLGLFYSFYFLWNTTATIGYGDVMMSGGNVIVTGCLGLWLATTCGLVLVLGSEVSNRVTNVVEKASILNAVNRLSMHPGKKSNCKSKISGLSVISDYSDS